MQHIRSSQPYFPPSEVDWVVAELRSVLEGGILTNGPRVQEFELAFANYLGVKHAIAVSNGTIALELILRYQHLDGAEVVVPTNTFLSSANAVLFAGGIPVLADIQEDSLCIGLEQIEETISERTRGVMVVHIAGLVCPDMARIRDFCALRAVFVIEDAAHAHGAEMNGCRAGSLGDAAAFSFFPTKVMTTGEGGMVVTDDDELALFARTFRNHGIRAGESRHAVLGHNYRLDELGAVLGLSQLKMLDLFLQRRAQIASIYDQALASTEGVELIKRPACSRHSYYKYPVVLASASLRDRVATALRSGYGIETGSVYWPPCHLQPVVLANPGQYRIRGKFAAAENILPRVLCLPIHLRLEASDIERVIEAFKLELRMGLIS